jgi:hypothetical protein
VIAHVLVVAALVAGSVAAGQAVSQPTEAQLSFTVRLRGNFTKGAVCVGEISNLKRARRMSGVGEYTTGAWSPDGQRLAVSGGEPQHRGIRVFAADGSSWSLASRPRPNERDSAPAWSPGGTTLAFARYVFFGPGVDYSRGGVWLVGSGSSGERQISRRFAGTLAWSPTGDLIAADLGGEFNTEVDLLRETGVLERTIRVGSPAWFQDGVSWSPDGARLAVGGGTIVDRHGNEIGRYAPAPTSDFVVRAPAWSPDGGTIAYERARSWSDARTNVRVLGDSDLFLGSADGAAPTRLTATPASSESAPAWRANTAGQAGTAQRCAISGTSGRDVVRATWKDDLIDAGSGNDLVYAGAGNDFVAAGGGNDVLVGGPGRDELWGESGADGFNARDGARDHLRGGFGRDRAQVDARLDVVLGVERISPPRRR